MFRNRVRTLHFVGIGGIGMSGIAEVLLNLGYAVQGSDLRPSATTERLSGLGARIRFGHAAEHVEAADVVVISSAVKADNPEVQEARERGVPVIRRAEMLAELMRLKYGVAIAGTHGKTTTTSLVSAVLDQGGIDPTVVIGGRLKSIRTNAKLGTGEYMVAEADESDGSFLNLVPTIAVITNIDAEHLDHWRGGLAEIVEGFRAFANKVPFYGAVVACVDHPTVRELVPQLERRVLTYGLSEDADYRATDLRHAGAETRFDVWRGSQRLGEIVLGMIGTHNVLNALAAVAVGDEIGVDFASIASGLAAFEGVGRRFEVKGEAAGVLVADDYAHHPEEIRATLTAARQAYDRRLVVAFQPHRYTRTRDLLAEFCACFGAADVVFIGDIYAASEAPIPDITAARLADGVRTSGHQAVQHVGDVEAMRSKLAQTVQPGDLVLTLGAGDIWQAGEALLETLERH